ncbi:MAG: hypothetical protein ACR2RF_10390 [Geminicoccaceae bacterium]
MSKLQRANALLDAACQRAGVDPIAMRIQMAKTIKDAHERQINGTGYSRQGKVLSPLATEGRQGMKP